MRKKNFPMGAMSNKRFRRNSKLSSKKFANWFRGRLKSVEMSRSGEKNRGSLSRLRYLDL